MIPSWSDKHPGKRARKIYNGAWIGALVGGFAVTLVLLTAFSSLAYQLGWPEWTQQFGGGGVAVVVLMAVAHARGVRALRRAGLVREQSEIIERTATNFLGEPLEVRQSSVAARVGFVAFFLLLVAGCYWLFQSSPFNPLYYYGGAVGALFFGVLALLMLFHADKPELRLDERGIISCQGWTSARLVRWEQIARLECKRVWGLPPNYEPSATASEIVTLQDENGKTLLMINAGNFTGIVGDAITDTWMDVDRPQKAGAKPSQTQVFVAELKRRLTAATPPATEESHDE